MKFWCLSLFQKSAVLVLCSSFCLAVSYCVDFFSHGELVLNSELSVVSSLTGPFIVMILGTEGHLTCDANERRPDQLLELWSIWSSFLVMLALFLYFGVLPSKWGLFVMPLSTIVVTLPWFLWQRSRIRRRNDRLDAEL